MAWMAAVKWRPGGVVLPVYRLGLAGMLTLLGCGSEGGRPSAPAPSSSGDLLVSTRTVGDQLDSDGYTIVLDGGPGIALPIDGEIRVTNLTAGSHSFNVSGVAPNCRLTNRPTSGSLSISTDAVIALSLEVFCLQPNPGRIFYTAFGGAVHVMNALGGDKQVLPIVGDKVELSPDQQRIVIGGGGFVDPEIWAADADGSNLINLTNTPNRGEMRPSWSPDAQQIAYERQEVIQNSEYHIFVMNADGSGVTNLAPPEWTGGEPAWSPDGTRIAFRSHHGGSGGDLWTIAPDGSQLTQLTIGGSLDTNPSWSPDGKRLVFTRFRGALDEGGTDFDLFVINRDGTGLTQLTDDDRRSSEADWSPDGRWIVFASGDLGQGGVFDLFMMRSDGTDRLQLTFGERAGLPNWVP